MSYDELLQDIPQRAASDAYARLSHDPDGRGRRDREDYARVLLADYERLRAIVPAERRTEFESDFEQARLRLKGLYLTHLSALSRTASAFIVGPAKFPTDRNRKRQDSADRRYDEFKAYRAKAWKAIEEKYNPKASSVITSGEPETLQKLRQKLAALEAEQAQMVAVNKAIRTVKNDRPALVERLAELGLSRALIDELLTPYYGSIGYQPFRLSNNNAEIRRVKGRIEAELQYQQKAQAATPEQSGFKFDGGRVELNYDDNRFQIIYDGKPNEATRNTLKRNGFRWAPSAGAWQRQLSSLSQNAQAYLLSQLGISRPTPNDLATAKARLRLLALKLQLKNKPQ